jgi:hypothetical protein
MFDIAGLIDAIERIVASHALNRHGAYRRWNTQNASEDRDLGINEYGCADACNILYAIGRFPIDPEIREDHIRTLQELQDPDTGLFAEITHHPIHTTAHCIGALELFDAKPKYQLTALQEYKDLDQMHRFLNALDWEQSPWGASHQGAGLYAAMVMAGEVDRTWQDQYFKWFYDEADPESGFWRKDCVKPVESRGVVSLFPHLAGSFHYLFNHEYARRPLRYPDEMVDSCLKLYDVKTFPLGNRIGFAEIDWVYCLTRALAQSGHRHAESKEKLGRFAADYVAHLTSLDPETHDGLHDLHGLFGAVCCLAELQKVLPGTILTDRPLKLVLDRRPFI